MMRNPMWMSGAVLAAGLALAVPATRAGEADTAFYQRAQVANFSARGTRFPAADYEALQLWADAGGARRARYAWGPEAKELTLRVLGRSAGGDGFALGFPNGLVLDAIPQGEALRLRDRNGTYDKVFEWKYEGPVEGRGTACTACVDEAEAVGFVRRHFIER